jgi:hypothetical protein
MSTLLGLKNDAASTEPAMTDETNLVDDGFGGELEVPMTIGAINGPVACYKNKAYRRFQFGQFNFIDHLCYVYSEEEKARFEAEFVNLPPIEQMQIVEYNFRAVQNLEKPVGLAVRGMTSSTNIKDPKVVK